MAKLTPGFAAVSFADAAARLARSCSQLYQFWGTLQEAPLTVQFIKTDLRLLQGLLREISVGVELSPPVALALDACNLKVQVRELFTGPSHLNTYRNI